jgi:hypothetical protein
LSCLVSSCLVLLRFLSVFSVLAGLVFPCLVLLYLVCSVVMPSLLSCFVVWSCLVMFCFAFSCLIILPVLRRLGIVVSCLLMALSSHFALSWLALPFFCIILWCAFPWDRNRVKTKTSSGKARWALPSCSLVLSSLVLSYLVLFHFILPSLLLSFNFFSCFVLLVFVWVLCHLVFTSLVLPCLALFCVVLSCLVLSFVVLFLVFVSVFDLVFVPQKCHGMLHHIKIVHPLQVVCCVVFAV